MATRGPRPKPKKSPAAVPAGERGFVPPMPAGLSDTARAKWVALVPLVAPSVRLRAEDANALGMYCEAAALREKAVAELDAAPLLLTYSNGAVAVNPLTRVIKEQNQIMVRLAERFGLDPASRKKLQVEAEKNTPSAFAEFLYRAKHRPRPELA